MHCNCIQAYDSKKRVCACYEIRRIKRERELTQRKKWEKVPYYRMKNIENHMNDTQRAVDISRLTDYIMRQRRRTPARIACISIFNYMLRCTIKSYIYCFFTHIWNIIHIFSLYIPYLPVSVYNFPFQKQARRNEHFRKLLKNKTMIIISYMHWSYPPNIFHFSSFHP